MQKFKLAEVDMAYGDYTVEETARRVAEEFGILVEVTGRTGGGGWPTVNLIGTAHALMKALTAEGGWSCGDEAEDAEMVLYYFQEAKPVFG